MTKPAPHGVDELDAALDAFVALLQDYHEVVKATGRDGEPSALFAADARLREAASEYQDLLYEYNGWSSPLGQIEAPDDGESDPLAEAEAVISEEVAVHG
jgi:hypothetical protein